MSLTEQIQQIDRRIKTGIRTAQHDGLNREEAHIVKQLKQHTNEVRLDVRQYEYAETLAEQRKAGEAARRNLAKLEKGMLQLNDVFGAADIAELGALIDTLRSDLL